MYTRSYFDRGEDKISLPESYDGIAFSDGGINLHEEAIHKEAHSEHREHTHREEECEAVAKRGDERKRDGDSGILSLLGRSPLFGGLFEKSFLSERGIKLQRLGTEELLIIATALFLFFSKEGDRECAIMLFLLLFIS